MVKFLKYFLFVFFSFSIVSFTFADINLQGQMPRAEFSIRSHNFGDVYQGQQISYQFPFQNTGNGTLILTSLHASCGCVSAKTLAEDGVSLKNIFKSGEKGFVAVLFDTSQFAGNIFRTITVETNTDMVSPTISLSLTGNIKQEILTTPAMLYLGKVQKNNDEIFYIKLDLKKNNLKILGVESDLPFVKARIIPSNNPNSTQIAVQMQKTDTLPIGHFQGNLIVSNTSSYYREFKIPVMGEVIGHVETSTKFLEFGVVNKDSFTQRTISFKSKSDDFEITGVKIDMNNLLNFSKLNQKDLFEVQKKRKQVEINGENTNEYTIKFTLKYPAKNKFDSKDALLSGVNVSGSFLIETNDPDYAKIKVPFFGILKQE